MKNVVLLLLAITLVYSCHKKAVPPATAPAPVGKIVVDGYGRIVTPLQQLPKDAGITINYGKLARAFTPNQQTNLRARYKTIPPKVLYIPNELSQTSAKGQYVVYRKKFYYWKKADGLYHLDEVYYR